MQKLKSKEARSTDPSVCPINLPFHPDRNVVPRLDRGRAENFVKAFKKDLAMDRLSCHRLLANPFRLRLHGLAYLLEWFAEGNLLLN